PEFELLEPHPFSLVCFRPRFPGLPVEEANRRTLQLLETLNDSGELYLSHTKVDGRVLLRLAVGSPQTERRHVLAAWERIRREAIAAGQQPADRGGKGPSRGKGPFRSLGAGRRGCWRTGATTRTSAASGFKPGGAPAGATVRLCRAPRCPGACAPGRTGRGRWRSRHRSPVPRGRPGAVGPCRARAWPCRWAW